MTTPVIRWRVYCETESEWSEGYLAEGIEPSVCFNDTAHTINTNSFQELAKVSNNNVSIIEEVVPTGGYHKSVSYKIDCTPGVSTHDYIFDYAISAFSISFNIIDDHRNDTLETIVAPNTIIGVITSDVSIGDTIINVSPTVIQHIKIGFYVNLDDSNINENLGIVTNIDTINSTITVKTASTTAFSASSPTYVKMSIKAIDNFTFGYPGNYVLGGTKIGGSYIPANTIIRIVYTNNGETTKYFYPVIDYLY